MEEFFAHFSPKSAEERAKKSLIFLKKTPTRSHKVTQITNYVLSLQTDKIALNLPLKHLNEEALATLHPMSLSFFPSQDGSHDQFNIHIHTE